MVFIIGFRYVINQDNMILTEKGDYTYAGTRYSYGIVEKSIQTDSDGYLRIETPEKKVIVTFDDGGWERAVYVSVFDGGVIAVYERYLVSDMSLVFKGTTLVSYDNDGTPKIRKDYSKMFSAYANRNFLLLAKWTTGEEICLDGNLAACEETDLTGVHTGTVAYQFQGQATINQEEATSISISDPGNYLIEIQDGMGVKKMSVTIDAVISGIEPGNTYESEVMICSPGVLTLDDETYVSGTTVATGGIHVLTVSGPGDYEKTYCFSIAIRMENVYDGMETTTPFYISSNAVSIEINGSEYAGEELWFAGQYDLVAYGTNGMKEEINFVITPYIEGVEDGGEYEDTVEFWTNCDTYVNGEAVSNHFVADEKGTYEIILMADGCEYKSLSFTVVSSSKMLSLLTNTIFWTIVLGVISATGIVIIYKKK